MSLPNFKEWLDQFDERMTVLLKNTIEHAEIFQAEIACYVPYAIITNKYLYFLVESVLKFKPLISEVNKKGLEMKQQ